MEDKSKFPPSWKSGPRSQQSSGDTREALVALNFRVPFELRQRIKLAATTRGMTMTEFLSAALRCYIEEDAARSKN